MKLLKFLLLNAFLLGAINSQGCCSKWCIPTFRIQNRAGDVVAEIKLVPELTRQDLRNRIIAAFRSDFPASYSSRIIGSLNVAIVDERNVVCLDLNSYLRERLNKAEIKELTKGKMQTRVMANLLELA